MQNFIYTLGIIGAALILSGTAAARNFECFSAKKKGQSLVVKVNPHSKDKRAVLVLSDAKVQEPRQTIYVDKAANVYGNTNVDFEVYSVVDQSSEDFRSGENIAGTKLGSVASFRVKIYEEYGADGVDEDGTPFSFEIFKGELIVKKLVKSDEEKAEVISVPLICN